MTDEFQRGLITGLAMQPLQVTTEHAEPDAAEPSDFIHGFHQLGGIIGIFRVNVESTE